MARLRPEINAGSMADIAFLLLIFFLVTATMDVDSGLKRKLPPLPQTNQEATKVAKRNIFEILINSHDQLLVNSKEAPLETLKDQVVSFIRNPGMSANLPDKELLSVRKQREADQGNFTEVEALQQSIDLVGDYPVSLGIISLQNDRGTSYDMYVQVQDQLTAAFRTMRDELSLQIFGVKFSRLKSQQQIKAIETAIPMNISEAEPVNTGGTN
jgi:biopolymer transport protein ExbD